MRENKVEHQLIDVREPYERDICCLNGYHIPMDEILNRLDEIRRDVPAIIFCRSGKRGAAVVDSLQRSGIDNVQNLEGGIMAWIEQVDPSLEKY